MEVYIARQPIFHRTGRIYGYELLYRQSMANNYFEGKDQRQASVDVINNAFLVMNFYELTDGMKGFINIPESLLQLDMPKFFPKHRMVIELLEQVNFSEEVKSICKGLKEDGYLLALDDFNPQNQDPELIPLVDIVKVEFRDVPLPEQKKLIRQYGKNTMFLAEKVETKEEFEIAYRMGYELFQGYYFSKPIILSQKDIGGTRRSLLYLVVELNKIEPSYGAVEDIFKRDVALSYKLLKLANSVFFASSYHITSIKGAIIHVGLEEMRRWVNLLILKEPGRVQNMEYLKSCIIRARFMELLGAALRSPVPNGHLFLAGMFCSIDSFLSQEMALVIADLGLPDEVGDALLGKQNAVSQYLDLVRSYEKGDWMNLDSAQNHKILDKLGRRALSDLYIESLAWVMQINWG